jgi:hypothetical protein
VVREQEVLEVEWPMICYNHPVSVGWLIVIVLKMREEQLIEWL